MALGCTNTPNYNCTRWRSGTLIDMEERHAPIGKINKTQDPLTLVIPEFPWISQDITFPNTAVAPEDTTLTISYVQPGI